MNHIYITKIFTAAFFEPISSRTLKIQCNVQCIWVKLLVQEHTYRTEQRNTWGCQSHTQFAVGTHPAITTAPDKHGPCHLWGARPVWLTSATVKSWKSMVLPPPTVWPLPHSSAGTESVCNAGGLGSIPGLGRSPGEAKGYPLQYPGLENSMDCIVYGVTKSWTRLSNFHFTWVWTYSKYRQTLSLLILMTKSLSKLRLILQMRIKTWRSCT